MPYGWRARIGVVIPSRGDTMLYEFYKVAPDGMLLVPYILNLAHIGTDELNAVNQGYVSATEALAREVLDVIYVGGLQPLTVQGVDRYHETAARLREVTDVPIVTAVEAEIGALQRLGVTRVGALVPYGDELVERMATLFSHFGIEVVASMGRGFTSPWEISLVGRNEVYRDLVRLADGNIGRLDGLFLANVRWPSVVRIAAVEERTGLPAVSASQAWIWATLRALRARPRPGAWGSLLDTLVDLEGATSVGPPPLEAGSAHGR